MAEISKKLVEYTAEALCRGGVKMMKHIEFVYKRD